jgi:site-specific DNA recombinase
MSCAHACPSCARGKPTCATRSTLSIANSLTASDREAYLKLATDLEGFLAQLHNKAEISSVAERQRVLRLLVKDVLIGPDKITIRHRIPLRERATKDTQHSDSSDTEGEHPEHCPLRWRRSLARTC